LQQASILLGIFFGIFFIILFSLTRLFCPTRIDPPHSQGLRVAWAFQYYLSVLSTFKNEALYLAEWLEFHLLVGVDHFFLINHRSQDDYIAVLEPYVRLGCVSLSSDSNYPINALRSRFFAIRNSTFWLALIDIDEFMVPISVRTIPEFLQAHEDAPGVVVNWLMYSSGGHRSRTPGLVIERFTDFAPASFRENRHVKSILNPRKALTVDFHVGIFPSGTHDIDTHGRLHTADMLDEEPLHDVIRINHYWTKSWDEWLIKRLRGRAGGGPLRRINEFGPYEQPFGGQDDVMNKYVPLVKQALIIRIIEARWNIM
jgi:hypothetical protein